MNDQQQEVKPDIIASAHLIEDITESLCRSALVIDKQAIRSAVAEVVGNSGVWSRTPESVDMVKRVIEQEAEIKRLRQELGQENHQIEVQDDRVLADGRWIPVERAVVNVNLPRDEHFAQASVNARIAIIYEMLKELSPSEPANTEPDQILKLYVDPLDMQAVDKIRMRAEEGHAINCNDALYLVRSICRSMQESESEIKRLRAELGKEIKEDTLRSSLRVTHTHTYTTLEISQSAFDEIKGKLEAAGYQDQFQKDGDVLLVDMHGIAVHGDGKIPLKPDTAADRQWQEP